MRSLRRETRLLPAHRCSLAGLIPQNEALTDESEATAGPAAAAMTLPGEGGRKERKKTHSKHQTDANLGPG